jgi:hypothetical protein
MADAQGGGDGQALAMQTPTPPLAAPARRKRPVVPRMPRLREGTHRHLQGRPQAHLAVSGGRVATLGRYRLVLVVLVVVVVHRRLGPSSSATATTRLLLASWPAAARSRGLLCGWRPGVSTISVSSRHWPHCWAVLPQDAGRAPPSGLGSFARQAWASWSGGGGAGIRGRPRGAREGTRPPGAAGGR